MRTKFIINGRTACPALAGEPPWFCSCVFTRFVRDIPTLCCVYCYHRGYILLFY